MIVSKGDKVVVYPEVISSNQKEILVMTITEATNGIDGAYFAKTLNNGMFILFPGEFRIATKKEVAEAILNNLAGVK